MVVSGYDSKGNEVTEKWGVREYLTNIKKVVKKTERINREKARLGIAEDVFRQKPYSQLVKKRSNLRIGTVGLYSTLEAQETLLEKNVNTKRNRLQNRAMDDLHNAIVKFKSFADADKMMEEILAEQGRKASEFLNSDGITFKSKKAMKEYLNIFSETIVQLYEEYEGQFIGWLNSNLSGSTVNGQEVSGYDLFKMMGKAGDEQQDFYREFVEERLNHIYGLKVNEAEEADKYEDMSVAQLEELLKAIRKKGG